MIHATEAYERRDALRKTIAELLGWRDLLWDEDEERRRILCGKHPEVAGTKDSEYCTTPDWPGTYAAFSLWRRLAEQSWRLSLVEEYSLMVIALRSAERQAEFYVFRGEVSDPIPLLISLAFIWAMQDEED